MSRKSARCAAMQLVFEDLFGGEGGQETLNELIAYVPEEGELEFIEGLVSGVREHAAEIDGMIASHLRGWTLDRISRVSRAALRLAVFELKWGGDVPAGAVIQEAVQLTQRFDEESEGRFVNGVLSSILRDLEENKADE